MGEALTHQGTLAFLVEERATAVWWGEAGTLLTLQGTPDCAPQQKILQPEAGTLPSLPHGDCLPSPHPTAGASPHVRGDATALTLSR